MIFVAIQLFQATIVHFIFEARKLLHDKYEKALEVIDNVSQRAVSTANSLKQKLRSLSAKLAKDNQINDRDEEEDDFEIEDCCAPCVRMFEVDVVKSNAAYAPLKIDALSRFFIPLAFFIFCAWYWPTLLKHAID